MFEDVADEGPSKEDLDSLAGVIKQVAKLKHEIAGAEALLKGYKDQLLMLLRGALPEALERAKLPSVTTEQGRVITRKQVVSGTWPKEEADVAKALTWLKEEGLLDLVKTSIAIDFDRGDSDLVAEVFQFLRDHPKANQFKSLSRKDSVHPQTLNAMLRERMEQGKETPLELFSGFTAWIADISEPGKGKGKK